MMKNVFLIIIILFLSSCSSNVVNNANNEKISSEIIVPDVVESYTNTEDGDEIIKNHDSQLTPFADTTTSSVATENNLHEKDLFVFENNPNTIVIPKELMEKVFSRDVYFAYQFKNINEENSEILIPQFQNVLDNLELTNFINYTIEETILDLISNNNIHYLDCVITTSNEDILSIFFVGNMTINLDTTPSPRLLETSITFDLKTIQILDITETTNIYNFTNQILKPENIVEIKNITEQGVQEGALIYLKNNNQNITKNIESIFWGNKRIFVLIGVPHVYGDYILLSVLLESE